MNKPVTCPTLFLSAPASGQGKTTITAALARLLTRHGKRVFIFKTGPDYLDPQILEQASGNPVVAIDLWMAGEAWCQQQLYQAACQADLILIEGAMGMFDGEPSSADLAARFNIPLVIIIDVKGMAQTAAAIAVGLATYRDDVQVVGFIANNCGSERHKQLIEDELPEGLPLLACMPRTENVKLPERHLGLVQAHEVQAELEICFNHGADALEQAGAQHIIERVQPIEFYPAHENTVPEIANKALNGLTIAVAKDDAFSFIYTANINLLESLGAHVIYFSPLNDGELPQADALWLPGGYPELHAKKLARNTVIKQAIVEHFNASKPILAECGGFLYCLERLTDLDDAAYPMLGILAGEGAMRGKRGCQGMQTAPLPEGDIRAHSHHRSRSSNTPEPIAHGVRQRHTAPGEAIYRHQQLTATYLHLFFPSNPQAIASLFLASGKQTSSA